jgi:hypothetical protein
MGVTGGQKKQEFFGVADTLAGLNNARTATDGSDEQIFGTKCPRSTGEWLGIVRMSFLSPSAGTIALPMHGMSS